MSFDLEDLGDLGSLDDLGDLGDLGSLDVNDGIPEMDSLNDIPNMAGMDDLDGLLGTNDLGGLDDLGGLPSTDDLGGLPGMDDLGFPSIDDLGGLPGLGDLGGLSGMDDLGGLPGMDDLDGLPGLGGLGGLPGLDDLGDLGGLGDLPGLDDLPGMDDIDGLTDSVPQMTDQTTVKPLPPLNPRLEPMKERRLGSLKYVDFVAAEYRDQLRDSVLDGTEHYLQGHNRKITEIEKMERDGYYGPAIKSTSPRPDVRFPDKLIHMYCKVRTQEGQKEKYSKNRKMMMSENICDFYPGMNRSYKRHHYASKPS